MSAEFVQTSLAEHPFVHRPHRTLVSLALPVMASLIVEPFANLVDTAFVERLGAAPAAGLGAATILLSGTVWLFNFLNVGAQTEVAQTLGAEGNAQAGRTASLAMGLALLLGVGTAVGVWPFVEAAAAWMSEDARVQTATLVYLRIRLLGAPGTLLILSTFGVLRGLQDMKTPLWIAGAISLLNVLLDPILIFGLGPIPAYGIAGAAWATTLSQVLGAGWALWLISRRLPLTTTIEWTRARRVLAVGRDLALRTGASLVFMLIGMRTALEISVEAGAAHQALRQVWMLLAFLLDAFAVTAQSLIGYFVGAAQIAQARQVARIAALWGLGIGVGVTLVLLVAEEVVATVLVPRPARELFTMGWTICALSQPINAVSFVTDGIHWGTGDYAYLRNAMLLATVVSVILLQLIDRTQPYAFSQVWLVMVVWTTVRGICGAVRVWPGVGNAVLKE